MLSRNPHVAWSGALAASALSRKYLLHLRWRAVNQRRLRDLQGRILAGPLLMSVRRTLLSATLLAWVLHTDSGRLACRVRRSWSKRWVRNCFVSWLRQHSASRMGCRAVAAAEQYLRRLTLRSLKHAIVLRRFEATAVDGLHARTSARQRRELLCRWRFVPHGSRWAERRALSLAAAALPRVLVAAGFRVWVRSRVVLTARAAARDRLLSSTAVWLARLCLRRWRQNARTRAVDVRTLRCGVLRAAPLRLRLALYSWRVKARAVRGVRWRRARARASWGRRLERRAWRGWLHAMMYGRERRCSAALEKAANALSGWRAHLVTRGQSVRISARAQLSARRKQLFRGIAALRQRAVVSTTEQLAAAAARRYRRRRERSLVAAALARWAAMCAAALRAQLGAAEAENVLRSELLVQARR